VVFSLRKVQSMLNSVPTLQVSEKSELARHVLEFFSFLFDTPLVMSSLRNEDFQSIFVNLILLSDPTEVRLEPPVASQAGHVPQAHINFSSCPQCATMLIWCGLTFLRLCPSVCGWTTIAWQSIVSYKDFRQPMCPQATSKQAL